MFADVGVHARIILIRNLKEWYMRMYTRFTQLVIGKAIVNTVLEFSLTIYYTAEQLTAPTEAICSMKLGDKERNKLGDKERNNLGDKERNK